LLKKAGEWAIVDLGLRGGGPLFSGCVTRMGHFTIISTRGVDWDRAAGFVRQEQRIHGEDLCRIIIVAPSKSMVYIDAAVDDALGQIPGAIALVDVVISYKNFYLPFIYGEMGFMIEGRALIDPAVRDRMTAGYLLFSGGEDGVFEKRAIARAEYETCLARAGLKIAIELFNEEPNRFFTYVAKNGKFFRFVWHILKGGDAFKETLPFLRIAHPFLFFDKYIK
jgi:hypothetical protein